MLTVVYVVGTLSRGKVAYIGFSPIPDLGGIGLHLACYHVLGVGKALDDSLRVVVDDAMQHDFLKVHGTVSIWR